ncbi:hypothetical protein PC116_g16063 [Phytophthora cactorum]|uniref:DUF3730 domain-containing protein n=1 Tax=Phytophthora cactorum TaxID=29920 RepID=A0A8T1FVM3_9STRA|nr:hypothetical protein PC112_g12109 [Phytophthora cactorum]KAG2821524.1 hypothetical protein PC111_g10991 [Phytophthora cactorum]KAG2901301.1 hypothetical protein PC114_g13217 [Phytophthora cactorum]KAG2933347.1 hypothetical protein PC117_g12894 [Phytophthora cactorum]KAG2978187.1 hypothetical protein PC118_g12435 [Phytophthora cactorum]
MVGATPTLAALLKSLRQASTDPTVSSAMEQAFDRLISTHSLVEAQNLVFGLQQRSKDHHSAGFTETLYEKIQQAAAICTEPSSKAEFLGFVLFQESVQLLETLEVSTLRRVLFKAFNANNDVLSGYLAALSGADGPIFNFKTEGHKTAVLNTIVPIAWHFDENAPVRTTVVRILVEALELVPHSQLSQATYRTHVTLLVDLLSSFATQTKEQVALAARTARFVLESVQILIGRNVGVVALLQSLGRLAQCVPEAFWSSVFLTSAAYFLVDKCETPMEQQLILNVLRETLDFGWDLVSGKRSVYVEILLLPLSFMMSVHGTTASALLQRVIAITSKSNFRFKHEVERDVSPTETATHARLAVQLIGDEEGCKRWLSSLFPSEGSVSSPTDSSTDKWLALLLVALLSDARSSVRACAAKCLERQVKSSPKFWGADTTKVLVSSLVFLVSQHPPAHAKPAAALCFGLWMTSCLYSLAGLAATTTDTMRIILRLIDSMNGTAKMRSMALKLMFEVWRNESRVFPRLEAMLLESTSPDEDMERHVVRMATIKALCEKDPELGVQFISSIQGFLEDELESVVSMAMDAISALCGGDCLDFYVAFKIISQKMRKNKVTCADKPLFQERLCCFYALGGAECAANEKHALKLLDQTWEFADSEHPDVRKSAYAAMCNFPLDMLGLCMLDGANAGQESDDEDQMTEEEVEEQLDDLMRRLQSEHDPDVRVEIEKLAARVIEHESEKLTAGVGRGQRMASAASQQNSQHTGSVAVVSAAATKEMKALLPSRAEVQAMFLSTSGTTDLSGFLLAYQAKAVIDTKNVKRKDKLVRLATQNVDELVETVTAVLQSMELPWTLTGTSTDTDEYCKVFIRTQALIEGWRGFMSTYVTSLDELAELKTPIGVDDADVAFRVFSEGVAGLLGSLLHDTSNKNPQLRLKYSETIEELSRLLALSIEKTRVFSADDNDARTSSVGALMALQLAFGRRKVDASEDCSSFCLQLEKTEKMFVEVYTGASDDVLVACALLGLSHIAALYSNGDELETFEVAQWRQQRVKPIAERILGCFLYPKRQSQSSSSHGDVVLPLDKAMEASSSIERVAADFDQTSPGGILLRWTSLMGLVRLASGFSSIKRLDWLVNVRKVLADVWETSESASITAVALGPVLLHCVHFNVAHSSSLEKFVATSIQRAANSGAASLDRGFLLMAAAYVLCHLDSFGGFVSTIQDQTKLVIEQVQRTLEDGSGAVRSLALSAVANFFHLSFGISGSFVPGMLNMDGSVEITLDSETVAMLVESARTENGSERGLSNAVLGAIARAADKFYVSHKKKSFDVEIRTLPSNSLLAKTLEWLRDTNPSSESVAGTISETSVAVSLLDCLTSTDSVLPLLDYASLTHRVMLRFCSVDTSIACVKFAATQGSCDELLAGELLSSRWFGNADAALQAELITWISHAATRVPTDVLRTLLTTIFDILKDIWRRDTSSSSSVLLFDSWTAMLHDILDAESTRRIPESSMAMVNEVILEKMTVEIPFGPHASRFVEQFATRVLSKVDYGERGSADTFLMPTVSNSSLWSWWRNGVFVVKLAELNVLAITKREASLALQWISRHDFEEWTDDKLVDTYLQPLIAEIGALIAQHTRPGETVSSLLDVIDAFSRGISAPDSSAHSNFKRRASFDVVTNVLSWKASLIHEQHLLKTPRSEIVGGNSAADLLPFGLIACAHSSKTVSALGERLLALLQQMTNLTGDEITEYVAALRVCSRQMTAKHFASVRAAKLRIRHAWQEGVGRVELTQGKFCHGLCDNMLLLRSRFVLQFQFSIILSSRGWPMQQPSYCETLLTLLCFSLTLSF